MKGLTTFLTGGFLKGKRTYILGAVMALQALASWAIGDMTLAELMEQLPEILGGLGFMALRAGVASETLRKEVKSVVAPLLVVGLVGGLGLTGCATVFGSADSDQQRAFRLVGMYTWMAHLAEAYVAHPDAQWGIAESARSLDRTAYAAVIAAAEGLRSDTGTTATLISTASRALSHFSVPLFGEAEIPSDLEGFGDRSLVLLTVGADAAGTMNHWREQILRAALETMEKEGRAPTAVEWGWMLEAAGAVHKAIQEVSYELEDDSSL